MTYVERLKTDYAITNIQNNGGETNNERVRDDAGRLVTYPIYS